MWDHVSTKKAFSSKIGNSFLHVLLSIYRNIWIQNKQDCEVVTDAICIKIKDYIDTHYKDEIVFNSITAELNMIHFYLAHAFKTFSGYYPKQYQTRSGIGEAQSLLLSTDWGVAEVANAVGYDNVNNFHRIFNDMVGIPPA